jgi:hypothetical protein
MCLLLFISRVSYVICKLYGGRGGRHRMVAGFTTIHVQSVPITTNVVSSNPVRGEVYSIQQYVNFEHTSRT